MITDETKLRYRGLSVIGHFCAGQLLTGTRTSFVCITLVGDEMTIEPFISPKDQGASIESYAHSLEIQNVVHVDAAIPVAADDSAVMNIIADHSAMANAAQEKDPPSAVWSWWSNLFFLFGSLSYVLLAGLAFHIDGQAFSSNAAEFPTPSPTTFSEGGTRKHPRWWEVSYYQLVGAMAALWFFGNAVVDLAWALDDRRHQRQARFGGDDPRWDIGKEQRNCDEDVFAE